MKMAADGEVALLQSLRQASQDLLRITMGCKVNARKAEDPTMLLGEDSPLAALMRLDETVQQCCACLYSGCPLVTWRAACREKERLTQELISSKVELELSKM